MTYKNLIFDLDGTISDPKHGIVGSINYALEQNGFTPGNEADLLWCIGPPLDQSFSVLTKGADQKKIVALVESYRERYAEVGFSENVLYPGITDALHYIKQASGIKLGLCTSKRVDFAEQILKMFDLYDLFDFVSGGEIGIEKSDQLSELLGNGTIGPDAVMIGDRSFDLVAAKKNRLACAGVLWGYGSQKELKDHHPTHLLSLPGELKTLVD